ncbi:DUF4917 family protein [Luteolibacter sp. SL250]|uniref:DUF4917 family protein n=1 Tax=Luteolibacter sp. SL250 TaxID=2995170 RepID=UPI00226DBCE7|nr:DUF4917 family protein [Luteolibacter sp. SL250]WAC20892.1 DUF4917 family protein [Luteolibacter sp. SL250]
MKATRNCLILGNGASVALQGAASPLTYTSLYSEAEKRGLISRETSAIFNYFKSPDFEWVMRSVSHAFEINKALGIPDNKTTECYNSIKMALIECVQQVHPVRDLIRGHFPAMADFMKNFGTVFSLNYDLSVYWSIMEYNDPEDPIFKDCFGYGGSFNFNYESYREGSTLIFYPHGSLSLVTDLWGNEAKVTADPSGDLLSSISDKWTIGGKHPLFVSEGDVRKKLQAIRRSRYLNQVYTELSCPKDSAIIYGWACGEQDSHILAALGQARINRIGVSVYTGSGDYEEFCSRVKFSIKKIKGLETAQVDFFDSNGPGGWIAD